MSTVQLERRDGIAVLRLSKARGNAIDAALVDDVARACDELAHDDAVRGVLLASGHPKLFCPGLDLVTLIEFKRAELQSFMGKFASALWALYGLSKPVVAAVSGPAVAGGCVLALTADYRVLRRGAEIGLNEVKVGVPLPWSVALLLRATVAPSALARVALLGRNFTDDEAVRAGLADELADAEGFEERCLERLQEFVEKDATALALTKYYLRASVLTEMRSREVELVRDFLACWFSPSGQERLRAAVDALKKK
jgi:enoyl-CoA hydratase